MQLLVTCMHAYNHYISVVYTSVTVEVHMQCYSTKFPEIWALSDLLLRTLPNKYSALHALDDRSRTSMRAHVYVCTYSTHNITYNMLT